MLHAALGDVCARVDHTDLQGNVLPVSVKTLSLPFYGEVESWQDFLTTLANDDNRNQLIISTAIKSAKQVGTIILCAHIKHCARLAQMASDSGVNALSNTWPACRKRAR